MARNRRVAIDVGGTFTDVVQLVPETGLLTFDKVPTTPEDPTRGVLDGFAEAGAVLDEIDKFTHGTTLGLNALLTRSGARTAIISTQGFRDVYLLGRTDRTIRYGLKYAKPTALVERQDTFEVPERSLFDGSVHEPLDLEEARRVARQVVDGGYEAVAVVFLHSYANPLHERQMRDLLAEADPRLVVTLSHELVREYREYERSSTALLDAYIKPIVRRYLEELGGQLADGGFDGNFLMTRSGGGAMTASAAREQPVSLILSGPAGGVIGAAALSSLLDVPNLVTIDMGGTSLDASLVLDGEPVLYQGAEFDQLPINLPSLYIHTIGAGGGSIAKVDEAGALQVGPESAGAAPGPAAYGRGGTTPTFTDAALILGYLGTDAPLGGVLTLDAEAAHAALAPLAEHYGLSVPGLARGIVDISATKIMGAVRAITVEMGRDPQDFAMLSFGGGGGLVAVDVARELSIPRVIVPPGQGAFSAFGMLMADVQHDLSRTFVELLEDLDQDLAESVFEAMEDEARSLLAADGFAPAEHELRRQVDVRYSGQEHAVTVDWRDQSSGGLPQIRDSFNTLHESQYGHVMSDPVEITTVRLSARGVVDKPRLPELEKATESTPPSQGTREVYVSERDPRVPYRLYTREDLRSGHSIEGPAVVAEHTATTVVHRGDHVAVGRFGELVITLNQEEDR